jgi:hypothetical protein
VNTLTSSPKEPGRRTGLWYALAFLPACGAALLLSGFVMDLSHRQAPAPPSDVSTWALNVLPSLTIGLIVYHVLGSLLVSKSPEHRTFSSHLRRCVPLYVIAILLGVLIAHDAPSADFWSFGQLVLWPWITALGGIFADALLAFRRPRTS